MINLLASNSFSRAKDSSKTNEDAILPILEINGGYLFAIADGVGSYVGADKASKAVINYLKKVSTSDIDNIDLLFNNLKQEVSMIGDEKEFSKAATTLTFAFINGKGLHIGHIGDCRLYVKYENKLRQLTKDHTQHQKLLDNKIYTKKELKEMSGKNVLTTAISKYIDMKYDYQYIPLDELLTDNKKIILYIMSDGAYSFWDKRPKFSENTMNDISQFSNSLYRRIKKSGATDDHSLIGVEFEI